MGDTDAGLYIKLSEGTNAWIPIVSLPVLFSFFSELLLGSGSPVCDL
jgi:hypothetical protein